MEWPLSACVIIALLFCSLVCIDFITLVSGCVLCLRWGFLSYKVSALGC